MGKRRGAMGAALECEVCGMSIPLDVREHYVARGDATVGLASALGSRREEKIYDAFDCPKCGCQNIVGRRYRRMEDDPCSCDCCEGGSDGE